MKLTLRTASALLALAAISFPSCSKKDSDSPMLQTDKVKRGNVVSTISATGTVEPEDLVDIGAQVAGQISSFGKDIKGNTIDYGSEVEDNAVLARIDDTIYKTDVDSARATVESAKAGNVLAKANVALATAKLDQARRDWDRAQKLGPSEALASSAYDAYRSAFETAEASLGVARAQVSQSESAIQSANTVLERAERNLGYCTITSPVRGTIIDRRVNIGQTVVSSLNAPSLFLLAKDLKRMQVWVAVNEADIGNIRPDQPVTFSIDAFPSRTFTGKVGKVRLNASMTQNVVTYTVEVVTDNSDGTLLPYLTADVRFQTGHSENVLLVPNAALRWKPSRGSDAKAAPSGGPPGAGAAQGQDHKKDRKKGTAANRGTVYVKTDGQIKPVEVTVGITDGASTEVAGADLAEGTEVVISETLPADASKTQPTTNPFAPTPMRRH